MQFDEIRYCAEKDMFSFGFDYNNFDTYNITMGRHNGQYIPMVRDCRVNSTMQGEQAKQNQ